MKKKAVPAILIHLDWIETIKCLSHEQIGAFIIAMLDYANTGKEPKFKDNSMQALFISFKKQIDRDRKSYEEKCKKNSESAKAKVPRCDGQRRKIRMHTNACKRMRTHA